MSIINSISKLYKIRGNELWLLIGTGFQASPPRKGRLPHADDFLIQEGIKGLLNGKFKDAQNAAKGLCKEYPVTGASEEAKIDRLARAIRRELKRTN